MKSFEITKLSSKGQIVIPGAIRQELNVHDGTQFIVFTDGENILMKPIQEPDTGEFGRLIAKSRAVVKKTGARKKDLNKIIKKIRHS
jgi:AbrB family looped-hinge helix DNA binding protein